jgi:hypothetical protein
MSDTVRSFGTFIAEVEDGELHADLSRQLQVLIAELHEGRAVGQARVVGRLTVSFDFVLADGMVEVRADIVSKTPKRPRGRSIFWATPENNLTRRNPRQPDLPFRDVNSVPGPARTTV